MQYSAPHPFTGNHLSHSTHLRAQWFAYANFLLTRVT